MLSSSRELAAVVVRVGHGDREAFDLLYHSTNRKLYGIVLGIVATRSLADEILQEVYVKVWQRAGDFDPARSSPITWMAAIARNRSLDEVRRAGIKTTDPLDEAPDLAAELEDPMASRERSDQYRSILRCLETLDPARRDLILLAYYRGLSRDALAKRFDHPTATIKTWLHRSLNQLKQCLAS